MEEQKKFITGKSITWFFIALIAMSCYFFFINWGLMKVQGLDFFAAGVLADKGSGA